MMVSSSIYDFFQGNPFANLVGSHIEKATDCKNGEENWTLIMETCDIINSNDNGPRLAIRAIRRRLTTDIAKNKAIVLCSLTLLETCVKNCGHRFHIVVCSRDFLQELEKIVLSATSKQTKSDIPIIIRDRILLLIQTWFDSFKIHADLQDIQITYKYLCDSGVEFPMTDLVSMSPIDTPRRSIQPSKSPLLTPSKSNMLPVIINNTNTSTQLLPDNYVVKISNNLSIVQTNIDILGELMIDYSPLESVPSDAICLMKNLESCCQEMRKRLVELINKLNQIDHKDDLILFNLLRVNDEMNSILTQYERYERTRLEQANKPISENELINRMTKSGLADVYAAQFEVCDFYEGFSRKMSSTPKNDKIKTHVLIGLEIPDGQNINEDKMTANDPAIANVSSQDHRRSLIPTNDQRADSINGDKSKPPVGSKRNLCSNDVCHL